MLRYEVGLNPRFIFVVQTLDGVAVVISMSRSSTAWCSADCERVYQIIAAIGQRATRRAIKVSVRHSVCYIGKGRLTGCIIGASQLPGGCISVTPLREIRDLEGK